MDAASLASTVHLGELGLDGRLRPVPGILPAVVAAAREGITRVVVPQANTAEAELVEGVTVLGAVNLAEVARWHGARRRCDRPGSGPACLTRPRAASDPGSRRSHRSARGGRCARRGGGGRPSPAHVRTARRGQDDARAAASRHPPSPRRTRRADGSHDPLARRGAGDDTHPHAAVRGSAPLGERGGPGRRRIPSGATGRDRPCQRGSPVSRRGGRVPLERAGCPPSAAGKRSHRDPPRRHHRLVPGTVPAGARDQPVSVRRLRRQRRLMHLPADGDPPLPRATLRASSRPHRHRAVAGPGRRRACGDGRRRDRHHGDRTGAGAPGTRQIRGTARRVRRGASTPRCRAPGCARDRSRPPPRCAACSMRRSTAEPSRCVATTGFCAWRGRSRTSPAATGSAPTTSGGRCI